MSDDRAQLQARFSVPADRDLPPGRQLLHRENFMSQILNEPPSGQPGPDEQPREDNRRLSAWRASPRRLLATAAAVALVAGLGVTGGIKLSSHAADSTAAAPSATVDTKVATLLREVGKSAGAQPGGWPNAAYWYAKSTYIRGGQTYTREMWVSHYAANGSGELEDTAGAASAMGLASFSVGDTKTLTWDQLYQLPTNPAQLKATLEAYDQGDSQGPSAALWGDIIGLLTESPASPALRQALYEVAATIPGATVKGNFTDRLGRTGTAISLGDDSVPTTLVIDPANGVLLDAIYGDDTQTSGAYYSYTSQGPATSEPQLNGLNTAPIVVPSIIGDTVQQATKVLNKAGIQGVTFGNPTAASGSTVNREVVVTQSPAAGDTIVPATSVTITIKS